MTTQADTREAVLPEPKYLAKLSKDGEWAELVPATDWSAEMWAWGTEYVYSADQMRTALTELRAECERLREEMAQAQRRHVLAMESKHTAWELAIEQRDIAEARLEAAEARADEVERDAARLDYVLAQSVTVETDGDGQFRCVYAWTSPETYGPYAASERAAIDAAIEQDDHP